MGTRDAEAPIEALMGLLRASVTLASCEVYYLLTGSFFAEYRIPHPYSGCAYVYDDEPESVYLDTSSMKMYHGPVPYFPSGNIFYNYSGKY